MELAAANFLLLLLGEVGPAGSAAPTVGAQAVSAQPPAAANPAFSLGADGLILQTVLVLAVVVALAVIIVRFGVRRVVAGPDWRGGANLKVIERLSLEPRRSVILVRAGDKYLLLASSEAGVSLVREVPAHEVVTPIESGGSLKSIWQRMTGNGGTEGRPRT